MTTPDEGAVNGASDAAAPAAADAAAGADSQTTETTKGAEGSALDVSSVFAELEADNRAWLEKQEFIKDGKMDPAALAKLGKQVYQQEKLVGSSIRIPGKDATPEEREAFLNKLGRPETVDGYEFTVPKDLPEELPYDGERAKAYAAKVHELGLTRVQAEGLHDWFAGEQIETFKGFSTAQVEQKVAKAKEAAADLVKEWGPLDGETAKANLQFADKVLDEAEPAVLTDLQTYGVIGPNKEIFSSSLAKLFAKLGSALYKEDGVLKGNPSHIGNPYETGNLSQQMAVYKDDPSLALSMIAAAGKKPEDFGLKSPR